VMDFHGLAVDGRLEGVRREGQRGQLEWHVGLLFREV
jgi:hypothetical protein